VDGILVAAGRDQSDAGAFPLNERIGAHGGSVREHGDIAAKALEGQIQALGRHAHRREHAFGEILGCRRRFGRGDPAAAVEHHAIGERAADVDADEKTGHRLPQSRQNDHADIVGQMALAK
jgi:hypothetical protein